jgi:catechol 2,3-dioxygenase-like lactoylglutathione lyase family enzyme
VVVHVKLVELAHFTDNVAAMSSFYQTLFGCEPVAESDGMAIFLVGETKIFIHRTYVPGEGDLPPENHTAYAVPDVDATCRELLARGLSIELPPRDYYWGRSAYLRDPDGRLIEIIGSER